MTTRQAVERLLSQLCSELGFCAAARNGLPFLDLARSTPQKFTDAVLRTEGLSTETHQSLAKQVQQMVVQHFAAWQGAETGPVHRESRR
jgi:hypothetical protein